MTKLNHHFTKLTGDYLFLEIEKKVAAFRKKFPTQPLTNLGVGDIARPLPESIVSALEIASREMGGETTFKGYGPSQGYLFLREAIAGEDYKGLSISPEEIFISHGANEDIGNIQEIFAIENRVAVLNPAYPVYIDTNVMAGRTRPPLKTGGYGGVVYLDCTQENGFMPELPNRPCDLIYLCSPNNPTGIAMTRSCLEKWVDYAKKQGAIILFDGAYMAYIRSPDCPRSIYEIEGAREVAIEFRSFSKTAGFTGLRCGYTVVPKALKITEGFQTFSLHTLWGRRQETKCNGVSYPVQKCAAAVYSTKGRQETRALIDSYLWQAGSLRTNLQTMGCTVYGGIDAPYLWLRAPQNMTSWEFFDDLLERGHLITLPGSGFGTQGEGYVRLATFETTQVIAQSIKQFEQLYTPR